MLFLLHSAMITELLMISEVIKHTLAREEALFCSEQPVFRVLCLEKIYPQFLEAYWVLLYLEGLLKIFFFLIT